MYKVGLLKAATELFFHHPLSGLNIFSSIPKNLNCIYIQDNSRSAVPRLTAWATKKSWFHSLLWEDILLFFKASRPALGPTQFPMQRVRGEGCYFCGNKAPRLGDNNWHHLMLSLRISEFVPPLPHAFFAHADTNLPILLPASNFHYISEDTYFLKKTHTHTHTHIYIYIYNIYIYIIPYLLCRVTQFKRLALRVFPCECFTSCSLAGPSTTALSAFRDAYTLVRSVVTSAWECWHLL
jgi:hypothetical protein